MSPASLTEISLANAARYLARRDRKLAWILQNYGPPPMWARSPGFTTLVRIILEQQVSLASAGSMFGRLRKNIVPLKPERFIELGEPYLRALGMTRQKTSYCLHLSESIIDNRLELAGLSRMHDAEARSQLMEVKGIGSWSADIYLLMALRRPDIWPASDLALASAITSLKN